MRPTLVPPPDTLVRPGPAPSFSVVIAAYAAADTIGEAVGSVLAQTVPASEIVICDDGSEDDLGGALAPYEPHISVVRQENAGEGSAKNTGARHTTGDFIAFLDADDVYLPERLEALAELGSERPDLDILTTDALLEVGGVEVRRCYEGSWTFEVEDQRTAILERNFVFGLVAVRRSTFLKHGGFEPSISRATDWDLWCRMLLAGSRAGLVNEPLARYRLRPRSLSADRTALLEGRCIVLERAAARDDLTPAERERVQEALKRERQNALLASTSAALRERSPTARRLALQVMRTRELPVTTRAKAALAALAPALAGQRLDAAVAREGSLGPAGVRFPS